MLRTSAGIWLLFSWWGWCLGAEDPAPAAPVYRYLILVETSDSMVRQKEVALDAIHELILTGFYNRIQRGDVLGVWPFKDQVNQKLTRPIHWSAREARDLSNFIYRKLRDIDFSKKPEVVLALAAAKAEARRADRLTVFLVTSGEEMFEGTPFDSEINAVLLQHGEAMAKAKRPFVTVLVFEGGEVVAQAVTPGGRAIFIPPSPSSTAASTVEPPRAAPEPTVEPPMTQPAVPPKPMTVEEIAAKLREAQAPGIVHEQSQGSTDAGVVPEPAVDPEPITEETPVPADEPSEGGDVVIPGDTPKTEPSPLPETVVEAPAVTVEPEEEGVQPVVEPVEPPVEVAPVAESPGETVVPPKSLTEPLFPELERADSDAIVDVEDSGVVDPTTPGLELPPGGGGHGRMVYLGIGMGLFVLAVALVLGRIFRPRRRGRASVISQSMYRK